MRDHPDIRIGAYLASHHDVISIRAARELGLTDRQVQWRLHTGRWQIMHRGVYTPAGLPPRPEARLLGACEAAGGGACASHLSAAWLWGLVQEPPPVPAVTVGRGRRVRVAGMEVHRRDDLPARRITVVRGIPVTDVRRTLADLGAAVTNRQLDDSVDVAIAKRLVRPEQLRSEIARLARRGRSGIAPLRESLARRGLVEPPAPSVLESRVLRLLCRWGITPIGVEVVRCGGLYRVDVMLRRALALEVDGYTYHSSPAAKARDSRRRNAIRASGTNVIESDWLTVMTRPEDLHLDVLAGLALVGAPGRRI